MLMKLAPKKRSNPRNFFLGLAALVVIAGTGRYFAYKAGEEKTAQLTQLAERLEQLNRALPRQLDAITRLEYMGLAYSDTILYRYRIELQASSLSAEQTSDMQAGLRRGLEQLACKEPQLLAAMRKLKIHQEHIYLAGDSKLFTIDLYPERLECAG